MSTATFYLQLSIYLEKSKAGYSITLNKLATEMGGSFLALAELGAPCLKVTMTDEQLSFKPSIVTDCHYQQGC
jgi:hypothetical protein